MRWLGGFFFAVVLPLLLSEFTDWCPWFARRLVRRAVRRLPEESRARWEEEWLEHLHALEGRRLAILVRGLWIYLCSRRWGRMLQGLPPVSQVLLDRIRALVKRPHKPREKPARRLVFGRPGAGKTEALEAWLASVKPTEATMLRVTVTNADKDHRRMMELRTDAGDEYRLEGREREINKLLQWLQAPRDEHPIKFRGRFYIF